ncbi:calcium-activated chloride channel regulator 1-like [Argiope bruennichi]|uniref:calcium-activated chloride channel regulator 1-like n=1 Tax=Argiope bruennichi TaxID=94029 RepID=UPI0024943A56|nr:calcium-activated chloride channel regulator 1-like [Argiope bruennichi]
MFWGLCLQFIVWTYVTARANILIDSDGGYKNVVVAIDSKIPESKISNHLKELEILFNNASKTLNTATRGQTFFKEIVFAVPKKYRSTLSQIQWISDGSYFANPDVILTSEDPFSGPYTLQNKGCGKPGLRIHVPEEFLSNKGTERAKAFVKEWAKYRYGVFDENGFTGDTLYPACYTIPGSNTTKVNDCADKSIVYNLRQTSKEKPEFCNPVPVYGKNNQVTSSLMSRTDLPQVIHFCDDDNHPHNRNAPSKQNLLCREQSTWNIISQHADFKLKPIKRVRNVKDTVIFKYVIEPEVRLIVAVDTSNAMLLEDRLDMVRNAFSYFVLYNLPEFSVVGLKNLKNRNNPLLVTVKTPADAEQLIDAFPEQYGEEEVCIHCGIEQALQTLKMNSEISQGQIVVISATDIDESRVANLENVLQKNKVVLHVLYFRKRLKAAPLLQKLTFVSGGSFFYIPEDFKSGNSMSSLTLIYEAFRSIYESFSWTNKNHVLVEQKTFTKDDCTTCSLSFQSDPSMENFQVLLTGPMFLLGPPVIRDKTVLSNGNQNFSAGHSSYSYKIKIPAYVFTIKNPKSNEWSLTFERRTDFNKPTVVIVRASGSKKDGIINMKTWINIEETSKDMLPNRPPITFYSEVKKEHLPVLNTTVSAILYHPESGEEVRLDLMDQGDGDPDITAYDGLFSRYFSEVPRSGYYILSTVAESFTSGNQSGELSAVSKSFRCCGSSYPSEITYDAGPFKRIATYGSFYVAAENARISFPPRRISDLRVEQVLMLKNRMTYLLKWTAPGNNYDHGQATDYQLRMFSSRDDALNNFESDYVLIIDIFRIHGQILEPLDAGSYQSLIIEPINATSGVYYLAMCTENSEGKFSEISNIVEINYDAPFMPFIKPTTPSITDITADPTDFHQGKEPNGDNFRLAIGLSIGFLFLFAIIGIILFLYCARRRKNQKEEEAKRQKILSQFGGGASLEEVHKAESRDALCQSNNALNVSVISPVNSWTAGTLISHYETLQKNKNSDSSESSTIQPKDMSDTNSTTSSKYSYVNKVDPNSSLYDTIYFPPQHEKGDINYPYNPTYGPFNPPYTSSLRRTPESQPYTSPRRQTPEYSQIYSSPRRQIPEVSSIGHGYSTSSINFYTYKSDRSPVHQLGTDL